MRTIDQYRSFGRPIRLLLVNQLSINLGFYMLMPYLAEHLSGELGLATWTVGLILGVRNFSQQGMFLLGGSLADRLGYKPLIVAGCVLRTLGFALLGMTDTVPALIVASAATGFAGALFNPAVRAYLGHEAGDRRVEAFALFNVFYQAGILAGPLVGLVLTGVTFRLTCFTAAAVFAVISVAQIRSLPTRRPPGLDHEGAGEWRPSIPHAWRLALGNRPFLLFAMAMTGSYVLSFQIYLALPLQARQVVGDGLTGTIATTALFVVSGLVAICGQMSITTWCRQRWPANRCLAAGLVAMAAAFVPPLLLVPLGVEDGMPASATGATLGILALLVAAALLALGTAVAFPFEMNTIVSLSRNTLTATHYGLYSTICGIGILAGNLLTGTSLDLAHDAGLPALPWLSLTLIGLASAAGLRAIDLTSGREPTRTTSTSEVEHGPARQPVG